MPVPDETIDALFQRRPTRRGGGSGQRRRCAARRPIRRRVSCSLSCCCSRATSNAPTRVLDAAAAVDPSAAMVIAEFRQLLRAEMARRQFWRDGRVPEFLGEPTEMQQALLAAIVALRAGDAVAAAAGAGQGGGRADRMRR